MSNRLLSAVVAGVFGSLMASASLPTGQSQAPDQLRFNSPEEALKALLDATKSQDKSQLRNIFGTQVKELGSGDEVQDQADLDQFARNLTAAAKLVADGNDKMILHVGPVGHPFAVPLVRKNGEWLFDTPAGLEELLNRRIGENELNAVAACRGYVEAQRDYYAQDWDDNGVIEYAQRIASTPGKKDGLYWETDEDEPTSPLGPLIAAAQAAGYFRGTTQSTTQSAAGPHPYHGYYYKILLRQGQHAAGGTYQYVINGHMVAGFALVAWPATWGKSGIMTFVVNSNGKLYEKDLGEKTGDLARNMTEYDPDATWAVSKD